ncbi:hypothetical protein DMN91_008817 [Ooceraea biroi]|uniref:Uncharacterized protein n=2 Tax=Ooceraea biroi TaxID=2015173 RepID=A0A3L8DDA8_OOCBI|nr:uncharacterized protein LOC105276149 isoform X1 [Ooceraea biroi]RLU18460.1 hypothetical protein DMN91_008817 [Ooceraea biroi]
MEITSGLFLVLVLNILWTMPGYAAPLLDTTDNWSQNAFAPMIKAACSSDGQCWSWLPMSETSSDGINIIPEGNSDTSRLQSRRQVAKPTSEFALRSWQDSTVEAGRKIRPLLPIDKQIPTRITKKDAFTSRSWSAGGMPFSVLYMNPHGSRSNVVAATLSPAFRRQKFVTTTESPIPSMGHSVSRVITRNGQPTVQPRKQYWTIPHMFISYGWGPFGK